MLAIVIGFPIALVLAWAFELTPEGLKRTEVVDAMPVATVRKKHAWIYVVVIGAAFARIFFLGRYSAGNKIAPRQRRVRLRQFRRSQSRLLYLENLSQDSDNAYFADGIHEEILTRLAGLRV